jgi:hypothetical protein
VKQLANQSNTDERQQLVNELCSLIASIENVTIPHATTPSEPSPDDSATTINKRRRTESAAVVQGAHSLIKSPLESPSTNQDCGVSVISAMPSCLPPIVGSAQVVWGLSLFHFRHVSARDTRHATQTYFRSLGGMLMVTRVFRNFDDCLPENCEPFRIPAAKNYISDCVVIVPGP